MSQAAALQHATRYGDWNRLQTEQAQRAANEMRTGMGTYGAQDSGSGYLANGYPPNNGYLHQNGGRGLQGGYDYSRQGSMGAMQNDYQYGGQQMGYGAGAPQQMLPQTQTHWNSGVQQNLQQNVHGQQHPGGWQHQAAQPPQPPPPQQQPPQQVNGLMSNQQQMLGQYGQPRHDAYGARNPANANTNPNQHHPQYAYAIRDGGR
jgi:hypothetical protein